MARLSDEDKEHWRVDLQEAQEVYEAAVAAARSVYYELIARGYHDGLSHLDISMALKMSPTTVRKVLDETRPRKRLIPRQ